MLKVLQICNKAPFPANDGSSIAIYNMARGFISNNTELHLLTINTKKHFKSDEEIPASFREASHYSSVFRNTDTSWFGALSNLFSSQSYFVSRFYFEEFAKAIESKLSETNFDVIQLEGLFLGEYIPLIRKNSKAKIVLRAHNIEYLIWERHIAIEKNPVKKWYLELQKERLKRFERLVWKEVDAIVAITDVDRNHILEAFPEKRTTTCITGVELDEYKMSDPGAVKERTVFSFASMDWMPNVEAVDWFLTNCWEKIHKAVPDCVFVIAGRNMPARFLHSSFPNVQVIERVASSNEFYRKHNIMLVPLLSGSGLRIKIIEGMAYGKAIVSTSIGAEGVGAINGRDILMADTPEEFAQAVIRMLTDDPFRIQMEYQARKFAEEHFSNNVVVKELLKFYSTLND